MRVRQRAVCLVILQQANCLFEKPTGRGGSGVGLRSFARCDCRFKSRWGYGCLSVVSVVCIVM